MVPVGAMTGGAETAAPASPAPAPASTGAPADDPMFFATGEPQDAIAEQLRTLGGIRIVLARQHHESDIDHDANSLMAGVRAHQTTLGTVLQRLAGQLGDVPLFSGLEGSATAAERGAPLTPAHARIIATAMFNNNAEFMNQAPRVANAHHAVGGEPSSPTIGAVIPFLRTQDPLALAEAMAVAIQQRGAAQQPAPGQPAAQPAPHGRHVVPATRNLAEVSIFTHGIPSGIELGSLGFAGAATVSARLSPLLTPNVRLNIYACAAAQGEHSFVQTLTEDLARDGANPHTADVFGHTEYGNTATITSGKQFHADAGQTTDAHGTSNWYLIFDAPFVTEQAAAISARLIDERPDATPALVERIIRRDGPHWLTWPSYQGRSAALHRATVTLDGARGSNQRMLAAFAVGIEPTLSRDAVRALWRDDAEGLAMVRSGLPAHHPHH